MYIFAGIIVAYIVFALVYLYPRKKQETYLSRRMKETSMAGYMLANEHWLYR